MCANLVAPCADADAGVLSNAAAIIVVVVVVVLLLQQGLSEKLIVVVGEDDLSKEAQRNATTTFMTNLRATLASKRVLSEYM